MWHLTQKWLTAGGTRASDGGSIAGGYQAHIKEFGDVKTHAKATVGPVDGPAADMPKVQQEQAAALSQDVAKLERYQGDPALSAAREALAKTPLTQQNLETAAREIEKVADQRIAALQHSLENLKNPAGARAAAEAEQRDVPQAEKALETRRELVQVADKKVTETSSNFTRDVDACKAEWGTIEEKTKQLLVDIPGHSTEEAAVLEALNHKNPLELAEALKGLQAKVDATRSGQITDILDTKIARPGWFTGDASLRTVLDARDKQAEAKDGATAAHAAVTTAEKRLKTEKAEAGDAQNALSASEQLGTANQAVKDLTGAITAAWHRPENESVVRQAQLVADLAPDEPAAVAAAKKALQEAIRDGDPEKLMKATGDLMAALPADYVYRRALTQEIENLQNKTFITDKGIFSDDTTTLKTLAGKVAARDALEKQLSADLPAETPAQPVDQATATPADRNPGTPVDQAPATPADGHPATHADHDPAAPVDSGTPADRTAPPAASALPASVKQLGNNPSEAAVDAALAELAAYVASGKPISPADLKAINEGLGDVLASRLAAIPDGKLPLAESHTATPENKALQRALVLADILSGDGQVRDIGGQGNKGDYDIDGYFGGATRQSLTEAQARGGLPAGPADKATLGELQNALRGKPKGTPAPAQAERQPDPAPQVQVASPAVQQQPPAQGPQPLPAPREEPPPDRSASTAAVDGPPKDAAAIHDKHMADAVARKVAKDIATEPNPGGDPPFRIRDEYRKPEVDDQMVDMMWRALRDAPNQEAFTKMSDTYQTEDAIKAALKKQLEDIIKSQGRHSVAQLDEPSWGAPQGQGDKTMQA